MIGFESYSPRSWLAENVLAVHVKSAPAKASTKTPFRKGKWSSNAVVGVMVAAAVFSSVVMFAPSIPVAIGLPMARASVDPRNERFADAPPGYFNQLTALVHSAHRLPAQSLALDPPVLI